MGACHCLNQKGGPGNPKDVEFESADTRPLLVDISPVDDEKEAQVLTKFYCLNPEESEESDLETNAEPKRVKIRRRGGVCAEQIQAQGYYKAPYWNKHECWEISLRKWLCGIHVLRDLDEDELSKIVRAMSTHIYFDNDRYGGLIANEGDSGDSMFVVLEGSVHALKEPEEPDQGSSLFTGRSSFSLTAETAEEDKDKKPKEKRLEQTYAAGAVIDAIMIIWSSPRPYTYVCGGSQCILARLSRVDFMNIVVRSKVYTWWGRQDFLRNANLLEMLEDENIAKLVDCLKPRVFEAGTTIIQQGDHGAVFYIMASGEARVWVKTGSDDDQEYKRYHGGELFGELALLNDTTRAANITAVTRCNLLCLSRRQFERLLGPMQSLHQQQYLTDPRKLIADFYMDSDSRGPAGTLLLNNMERDKSKGDSQWFAVYRPTSRDAIAKMLSGQAVGKGLNVKGKSAKQGVLSGYVPFVQISDNKHKSMIENSPPKARLHLFYRNKTVREEAYKKLVQVMQGMPVKSIEKKTIDLLDDYAPKTYGLDLPEPLLREAYIINADLSPVMGWETGRRSEPAFMDFNMHAVRDKSEPKVVLYQNDESDPMNPRGLLVAYAEKFVKPVVSDFDTFLVASRGMEYDPLPDDQAELIAWLLDHTEDILAAPDHNPWTVRWLTVLKKENERGFHPHLPKYGYGDPTSYRLIGDIVSHTADCGAVRHGAECFNFYFPQELDDEYLCVWSGFPEKPWKYKTEPELREWLCERIQDGYFFPLNPVWPVRDKGWNDVFQRLINAEEAKDLIEAWYPEKLNVIERMNDIRNRCPQGFVQSAAAAEERKVEEEKRLRASQMPTTDDLKVHNGDFKAHLNGKKSLRHMLRSTNVMSGFSRNGTGFMFRKTQKKKTQESTLPVENGKSSVVSKASEKTEKE